MRIALGWTALPRDWEGKRFSSSVGPRTLNDQPLSLSFFLTGYHLIKYKIILQNVTQVAEGKTLLTTRNSLNAVSDS